MFNKYKLDSVCKLMSRVGVIVCINFMLIGISKPGQASRIPTDKQLPELELSQATSQKPDAGENPLKKEMTTPELIFAALERGEIDESTAYLYLAYAFENYKKLPEEYHSEVPWDGTIWLAKLQEAVKTMDPSPALHEIETILAGGYCGASTIPLPNESNSTHFYIQYNASTIGGGLNINDYRDSLETAWTTEIDSFGWAAPPVLPSNPPPGNRYHVRLENLSGGLAGFCSNNGVHAGLVGDNPNTYWAETDAYASCIVLDESYDYLGTSALDFLQISSAHELLHAIVFGYGVIDLYFTDPAIEEGSTKWMEDEVFDNVNINYGDLWPDFTQCMGQYSGGLYSYWLTFRGLTERFGTGVSGGSEDVMQEFWENMSQGDTMLDSLDDALWNLHGIHLYRAFHDYAIAVKFNKACSSGLSYPYCLEEGPDYVAQKGVPPLHGQISTINSLYYGGIRDHYSINWIGLPLINREYSVFKIPMGGTMQHDIICDTGSTLSKIVDNYHINPTGCSSLVAVITNSYVTSNNPSVCSLASYELRVTNIIYVDGDDIGSYEIGTIEEPFVQVEDGVDYVPSEGILRIAAGSYPETLSITRPMTLTATGGTVTIGQ